MNSVREIIVDMGVAASSCNWGGYEVKNNALKEMIHDKQMYKMVSLILSIALLQFRNCTKDGHLHILIIHKNLYFE